MKYRLRTTKDMIGRKIFFTQRSNGKEYYYAKSESGKEGWVDEEWVYKNHKDIVNIDKLGKKLVPKNIQEDPILAVLNKVAKVYVTFNKDKFLDIEIQPYQYRILIRKANGSFNLPICIHGVFNHYDVKKICELIGNSVQGMNMEVEVGLALGVYGDRVHGILTDSDYEDEKRTEVKEAYKTAINYQKYILGRVEEMKKVIEKNKEYFIDSYAERINEKYGIIGLKKLEEDGYLRITE